MPEVASQADISYQDEIFIGRFATGGGTPTFTQIFGVETLNPPEKVPDDVDVTHQQSPGRSRETIPGLMSVADWSGELQFWPGHASQIMLDELATLTETGSHEDVLVEFVVGGMRRTYRGYVNAFTPTGTVGDKRMASLSMKIFERQASNIRVVA